MIKDQKVIQNVLDAFYSIQPKGKFFLLASPSWGKTSLILQFFKEKTYERILFISPLVALNLEFRKRASQEGIPVVSNFEYPLLPKGIVIITPEKLIYNQWENLGEEWADLIVFDEFHLVHLWQEFRPILLEFWYWLSVVSQKVLLLSATFNWDVWFQKEEANIWLLNCDGYGQLNLHGKKLIHEPKHIHFLNLFSKKIMIFFLKSLLLFFRNVTVLIFFPKREQVKKWSRWCKRYQLSFLSCLGGEVQNFIQQLEVIPHPQIILSTSVLSHGVNLPPRDLIFIWGSNWQEEIWIQMKSRGGRRGETFYLFSEKQSWMK